MSRYVSRGIRRKRVTFLYHSHNLIVDGLIDFSFSFIHRGHKTIYVVSSFSSPGFSLVPGCSYFFSNELSRLCQPWATTGRRFQCVRHELQGEISLHRQ